jgi:hypothetical protein
MKLTETAPTLPRPVGPPPWLGKIAQNATLEGAVLKQAVHGKDNILALISHARTLYELTIPTTTTADPTSSWSRIGQA